MRTGGQASSLSRQPQPSMRRARAQAYLRDGRVHKVALVAGALPWAAVVKHHWHLGPGARRLRAIPGGVVKECVGV